MRACVALVADSHDTGSISNPHTRLDLIALWIVLTCRTSDQSDSEQPSAPMLVHCLALLVARSHRPKFFNPVSEKVDGAEIPRQRYFKPGGLLASRSNHMGILFEKGSHA